MTLVVSIPASPDAPAGAVALTGSLADEELHEAAAFWPWVVDPGGQLLVHLSSLVFVHRAGLVSGFTPEARKLWNAYAAECKKSWGQGKLVPTPGLYDWAQVLSDDWKPREYQKAGMERLYARMNLVGRGCLLGDSVGLGKTAQAIGVAERIRSENSLDTRLPVTLVTTLSTLSQWADEVRRFARLNPKVVVAHGVGKDRVRRLGVPADWRLLTYDTARMTGPVGDAVAAMPVGVLVLDESARCANPGTATHAAVLRLAARARCVLPMNATPLENSLEDVFGQLRVVDRSVLGSHADFRDRYVRLDARDKPVGVWNVREFKVRTAAVMLRRTARECRAEVPQVVAEVRRCPMGRRQELAYREAIRAFVSDTSTGAVAMAKIAEARYRAFAADVADPRSESCKMDDLEHLLVTELSGERVIVISKFRRVVEFARARLAHLKPWAIHGGTSQQERSEVRRRFDSSLGEGKVLLGTEAIERGMNLQSAGVLYNLDLPWNAARLRQRAGRIARLGQERDRVLVLNACASIEGRCTVDDWLVDIVTRKRASFDAVFGRDGVDELGDDAPKVQDLRVYLRDKG